MRNNRGCVQGRAEGSERAEREQRGPGGGERCPPVQRSGAEADGGCPENCCRES